MNVSLSISLSVPLNTAPPNIERKTATARRFVRTAEYEERRRR